MWREVGVDGVQVGPLQAAGSYDGLHLPSGVELIRIHVYVCVCVCMCVCMWCARACVVEGVISRVHMCGRVQQAACVNIFYLWNCGALVDQVCS